jgi:hypothetical protein
MASVFILHSAPLLPSAAADLALSLRRFLVSAALILSL